MSNVTPLPLPAVPDTPPPARSQPLGKFYTDAELTETLAVFARAEAAAHCDPTGPSGLTLIRGGRS